MKHNSEVTNPKGFTKEIKSFSKKNEKEMQSNNISHCDIKSNASPLMTEPANNIVALKKAASMSLKELGTPTTMCPINKNYMQRRTYA